MKFKPSRESARTRREETPGIVPGFDKLLNTSSENRLKKSKEQTATQKQMPTTEEVVAEYLHYIQAAWEFENAYFLFQKTRRQDMHDERVQKTDADPAVAGLTFRRDIKSLNSTGSDIKEKYETLIKEIPLLVKDFQKMVQPQAGNSNSNQPTGNNQERAQLINQLMQQNNIQHANLNLSANIIAGLIYAYLNSGPFNDLINRNYQQLNEFENSDFYEEWEKKNSEFLQALKAQSQTKHKTKETSYPVKLGWLPTITDPLMNPLSIAVGTSMVAGTSKKPNLQKTIVSEEPR